MAIATLTHARGTSEVLSMDLWMPLRGAWSASVETGDDEPPTGAVTIEIAGDGGAAPERFVGVIRPTEGGAYEGRARLFVVGGAGNLRTQLAARHYRTRSGVRASDVARAIAAEIGEQLDPAAAAVLAGLYLSSWHRGATAASTALSLLADRLAAEWRVLSSGALWMGADTWPAADALVGFRTGRDAEGQYLHARPDAARLRPGVTVEGQRIRHVHYRVDAKGLAVSLGWGDRFADVRAAVAHVVTPRAYLAAHPARVVAEDGELVDAEADDPAIGGLSDVPLRVGLPGCRVVAGDARVRLGFEGGSPEGAFAAGFDQDPGADAGVARVADVVDCGTWQLRQVTEGPPPTPTVLITWTPPGASLPTVVFTATPLTIVPNEMTVEQTGKISTGSDQVFLRGPEMLG